ncbi:hypothetical protein [Deinococcus aquaedulcis]|uniref:hypothetical protein n=1 Tax=Deinococcus aquaedulcis TaxID=2840455 RepID=UPI001C83CCA6|nr:hypothetical protein [Deinococcus aquaedulcis]
MKKAALLTLPLLIASCNPPATPGTGSGSVTASSGKTTVTATEGQLAGSTTYTFTNKAGAREVTINSATLTWTDPASNATKTETVNIAAFTLPAGLSCPASAANPAASCAFNDPNTTFADRTVSRSISDAELFGKVLSANPSAANLPVSVQFNSTQNALPFTFTSSTGNGGGGGKPAEQSPTPVLEVVGTGPYAGNINVNVSGNFDAASEIERVVLQVTDGNNVVDNSTYTTTQARATFSVDTTRFANGPLKLKVIAYTKSGLTGTSAEKTVQVQNLTSPELSVAAPTDGALVNTPSLPVRITLTKRSADYTIDPQTIQVDVLDFRGTVVLQKTMATNSSDCVGTADSLTCNTMFDIAGLPADTYNIRVRTRVRVDPNGANITRNLETSSRFTANTVSGLPPAASIRFPAITDARQPGRLDSESGILVTVSDNTGVNVVEARVVGPFDATKPLALNGTTQCQESQPVAGRSPVDVLMLNRGFNPPVVMGDIFLPSMDIDGSAYVPDNNTNERYDLRVTTVDVEGNRNIQCIPITINRAQTRLERPRYTESTSTNPATPNPLPGELNYTSGTWTLSNIPNRSRVAAVVYQDGVQKTVSVNSSVTGSTNLTYSFGNPGTYQIVWVIQDMVTGIVTTVAGDIVTVIRNP